MKSFTVQAPTVASKQQVLAVSTIAPKSAWVTVSSFHVYSTGADIGIYNMLSSAKTVTVSVRFLIFVRT